MRLLTTTTTSTTTTKTILLIPLSYVYCLWLLSSHCCLMANGEFYSSVDSLKALGNMEATLLQSYRQYLKTQRQEIHIIRRFIEHIEQHQELAAENIEDYLGNPINAFILIKRMVNDWKDVKEFLKFDGVRNELMESLTQFKKLFKMPDENELKGAINGLGRLQAVYKLKAEDMANGKTYGSSLTWRDSFEIGTTFSDQRNYPLAKTWMELALQKLNESKESMDIKTIFNIQITEYLAWILQSLGESKMAIKLLDDIKTDEAEHTVKLTKKILMNLKNQDVETKMSSQDNTNYARLCRGERNIDARKSVNLNCRLDWTIHAFFTLAPLQVEPVHENPTITLYHNLLNDQQISKLILESDGKMERSQVIDKINKDIVIEQRVSQQMWLESEESAIAEMMYNLVSAITGFDMNNSEDLQVANYRIGGLYAPHYDFVKHDIKEDGDRISTNMYYLSNVEKGGYTVFPNLQVYLKPIKGAMVMWHNLHRSLDPDTRTLHAGCPVLKGSKRIANIWTHSAYQELRRPCGLKNDKIDN